MKKQFVAIMAMTALALGAQAATYYWDDGTVTVNGASGGGSGTWVVGGAGWENGSSAVNWADGNTAVLGGTAGTLTLGGNISTAALTLGVSGYTVNSAGNTMAITGTMSGAYTFTYGGAGAFTISGTNTNSGNLTIDAATVTVNSGAALFCAGLGWAGRSVTVQNGGTLVGQSWANGNTALWGQCGDATINLTLNNGTLRLKGSNASTLNKGILIGTGGGTITVDAGATFKNDGQTTARPILFDGTLTKNGDGALTVDIIDMNRNTSTTQGLTMSAGTLTVNGSFKTGNNTSAGTSRDATITQTGGSIVVNQTGQNEFTLANWGGATTANISGGTMTVNSYWGPTIAQRGTGNFTVSGSAEVTFNYSLGLTLAGQPGSVGNVYLNGGTLVVAQIGNGSGTGSVYFNGGTLKAGAASTSFMTGLSNAKVQSGGAKIDTNGNNITIGQSLVEDSGSTGGGLTKTGGGTLTLSGDNGYTGATTVNQGTLALASSGDISESATVEVKSGATLDVSAKGGWTLGGTQTLKGDGTVVGDLTANGIVAPGNSPGDLNFNDNLTLAGTLNLEVNGTGASNFDRLVGDGANWILGSGITLNLTTGYAAALYDSVTVLSNWNSISGTVGTVTGADLGGGLSWDTSKLFTDGTITVIPEPATVGLLGLVGAMALLRRRMKIEK